MTLTADRRVRSTARAARPGTSAPASSALPSARPALVAVLVLDDVYRVLEGDRTVGYIQLAGPVFVALRGEVYNTSVEIAQCLDLETAVARLECATA
jgi:hypothetical protein